MLKTDLYNIYQENLELLEAQIKIVKKSVQVILGKNLSNMNNGATSNATLEKEILAGTRLLTFLICSWLEAKLYKIIHESSSAAFTEIEILYIVESNNMKDKWKNTFNMSLCKSYGLEYRKNNNYESLLLQLATPQAINNIKETQKLFKYIDDAIEVRNKFAHGQWSSILNNDRSAIRTVDLTTTFDNIQKLDILFQCYKELSDIISLYVTYKDKTNPSFDKQIESRNKQINDKYKRIFASDFSKYAKPFIKHEQRKRSTFTES